MLAAMQLAPFPQDLQRLKDGLSRTRRAAASMERPLLELRTGPMEPEDRSRLFAIRNGSMTASKYTHMFLAASHRLRDAGQLPAAVVDALSGVEALDRRWLAADAYVLGVIDAGVVPARTSRMMWAEIPSLVNETQRSIDAVLAAFE